MLNQRIFIIGMVTNVEQKLQKDGKKYLKMTLCDKSNNLSTSKFAASETDINLLKNGAIIAAGVDIKEYKGQINGIVYNYEVFNGNVADFIDYSEGREWAVQVLNDAFETLKDSIYYSLVYNIITRYWDNFTKWPAGRSFHHNKMGGLLVHTAEVVDIAATIGESWQLRYGEGFINMPLLISASILHDIGKLNEMDVDVTIGQTEYSTLASLESHVTNSVDIVVRESIRLGIGEQTGDKTEEQLIREKEAIDVLRHCILAHHGNKEWGSPIEPNCPEAFILHKADEMSAAMYRYNSDFEKLESGKSVSVWTATGMLTTYKDLTK